MRAAILLIALTAQAGVVSRDWGNGKLSLTLDDGVAEVEWISGTAFRISRGDPVKPAIHHERVIPEFEDTRTTLKMRGRYITLEIDKATAHFRVSASNETISTFSIDLAPDGAVLHIDHLGKTYGLAGPGDTQRFFFTSGYGVFIRAPRDCRFELDKGNVRAPASQAMEMYFYYGPTPKEIFEQHQIVTGRSETPTPTPLPTIALDSWDALARLVETIQAWSLSDVVYPSLDVFALDSAKGELAKRAADLASMLPLLTGESNAIHQITRAEWKPYFATYLREAFDLGYPLIRPFPVEFSRDKNLDPQPTVFMLGDEVLLAPVVTAGAHRNLALPRGIWTDLRTNIAYKGNQTVTVTAPIGQVPMFARNGAVFPLAGRSVMELHYFPSLGGEFFLWEDDRRENSQFHAAPANEFMRLEIESKVTRTYEWVIHHTELPRTVDGYQAVRQRSALKPGTWWYDKARRDLHLMVRAEAGTDRIVNIGFSQAPDDNMELFL
jgi:alpha-glucosidase (family GH31 glycosyl hydrolase)